MVSYEFVGLPLGEQNDSGQASSRNGVETPARVCDHLGFERVTEELRMVECQQRL